MKHELIATGQFALRLYSQKMNNNVLQDQLLVSIHLLNQVRVAPLPVLSVGVDPGSVRGVAPVEVVLLAVVLALGDAEVACKHLVLQPVL